jgi:FkbM family methyltransferase
MPSFYYPYKFSGGRIYLDITESPMMLARVVGRYEPEKHKALEIFLRPGSTFVDVGANKGDFSLVAGKVVGSEGRVLAFEPEPTNYKWMRRSVKLNGYRNVSLYQIALSDRNGQAPLYLGEKSGWHTLVSGQRFRGQGVIYVETRTLDSFLEQMHFVDHIDVMKIDVEGAELQVLAGASATLGKAGNMVILIDVHPELDVHPRDVCEFLETKGFSLFQERWPFSNPVGDLRDLHSMVAIKS